MYVPALLVRDRHVCKSCAEKIVLLFLHRLLFFGFIIQI